MLPNRRPFTAYVLLLVTLVYTSLFTCLGVFGAPEIQILLATSIVTAFVVADFCFGGITDRVIPRWSRASMFVARYSTAFVLSVVACWVAFIYALNTAPTPVPQPSLTFSEVMSFRWLSVALGEGMRIFLVFSIYYGLFAIFCTAGLVCSLFALRHFRSARWFLGLHVPAILLVLWSVIVAVLDQP